MSATIPGPDGRPRCGWCAAAPEFFDYHDREWGFPVIDDRRLFEKLCLETFQSGLSWRTILNKRENFRAAFDGFDVEKVAAFTERDVERLLGDAGIIRHRGKIEAAVGNARAFLAVEDRESFSDFLWRFTGGEPIVNRFATQSDVPTETAESHALSQALRAAGFRFCGPVITYAFMEATGIVNDHLTSCHRHGQV